MVDRNYGAIRDANTVEALVEKLLAERLPIAFDIEAGYTGSDKVGVSLKQFHPEYIVVGISFTNNTDWARYIPFAHDDGDNVDDLARTARALWRMLRSGLGVAHNAAYELKGMSRFFRQYLWWDNEVGAEVRESRGFFPILSDTMIEVFLEACYDPLRIGKGLKEVSKHAFGLVMTEFKSLFPAEDSPLGPPTKKGSTTKIRFNTRSSRDPRVISYACEDSVACLLVHQKHYENQKDSLIYQAEMALLPILCEMELGEVDPETGEAQGNMMLDWALIRKKIVEVEAFRDEMCEEILQNLSVRLDRVVNINLGSPKQLADILFSEAPQGLGLPIKMRSEKTNAPSTSDDALKVIAKSDPIIKRILQYRQVVKLHGAYLNKYLTELNYHPSQRAFPVHNQAGALTGRMSVDQVSYQQWPKPYHFELDSGTTLDMSFRDLFLAPKDHRIIGFDYSQVELRIMAGVANETAMLEAFASGVDIHIATAAEMMGIPVDQVTKKQRAIGKALANDELVLTPSGWIPIGDIKEGDVVVVPDGGETTVEAVFPQGVRRIYKVEFEDGSVIRADGDHLWPVKHIKTHESALLTTEQILRRGLKLDTGKGSGTWKWYIENVDPLEFGGESDLSVDPYLLGILLGDGSMSAPAVSLAIGDEDFVETSERILKVLPEGVHARRTRDGLVFTSGVPGAYRNALDRDLKDLGLRGSKTQFDGRFGVRSWEKAVPQEYLFSGIAQRYALLRGIMDADATVSGTGAALLTTTSGQLAEDAIFLARSLGGRAKIQRTRNTSYTYQGEKKQGRLSYEVLIATPEVPFTLRRKAERWVELQAKKKPRLQDKKIISIKADGYDDATCIRVAHENHEFVTAGVTRTHNTLNFAIAYGSGATNIAEMLTSPDNPVTKEDAQEMLDQYFNAFSGLKTWMDRMIATGREQKEVFTHLKRKFTVWEYYDHRDWIKAKGDRMCVNAPIQGGAADYLKIAMIRAYNAIKDAERRGEIPVDSIRMVLTIHDALEFYVHKDITTQYVLDLINPRVSYPIGLPVEIKADWHEGYQLSAVSEIELDENNKISGYELVYELPWTGEAFTFAGDTLHESLDKFYEWEWNFFKQSATYYQTHNVDFELPKAVEALQKASEAVVEAVEVEPPVLVETSSGKLLTVSVLDDPTAESWARFQQYLADRPGEGEVRFEAPSGYMMLDTTAHLTDEDQPLLSLIFGGARLSIADKYVPADSVMEDITF